jgi:hypothetical protein
MSFNKVFDKTILWRIGNRRLNRVGKEYEDLGCFVVMHKEQQSGVDLMIFSRADGKLQKVIECTNYAEPREYINSGRLNRYIMELNAYDVLPSVVKELYVSYKTNISQVGMELLVKNNIKLVVVGCQD